MTGTANDWQASALQQMNLLTATASFTACSMGMMVFNKLAVRAFPLACSLVAIQMMFTVLVMVTICWRSLHIGSMRDVLRWSSVIPFFVGMLLTSMFALKGAPMSLVITFRALSPWLTLLVERFFPNPTSIGVRSVGAMVVMLVGVGLYAKDLDRGDDSSRWAILWVAINSLLACAERLLQRLMLSKDQAPVDISKTGISLLNNLIGLLPLLAVAAILHEPAQLNTVFSKMNGLDMFWVFLSCIVAVGISFCAIWAQSLISATSMLVLTNSNKFVVIILELYVLPDKPHLSVGQIAGAMLTILATVGYAMAREAEESERKHAASEHSPLLSKP